MDQTHLQQVKGIFAEALEKQGAQRESFLAQACEGDPALRAEVESFLAAAEGAGEFLVSPTHGRSNLSATAPIEGPGTQIGNYKLLQKIGEGGMGMVYMAEQQRPVRRRVALKIIKPGMDSGQVIARFEAERQALAMMDHPNIARVLDASTTDNGRPYFVMELVQGIPITKYCDDKQLDTRARLELFVQVCHAVQHAHQKGIIHRDLKPSNVLVMIYDSKPVPKIIDFGVAKALHHRLTEATMFTQFGAVVGTLEYMSPEQAETDALGIDTRSDIYSLGVLLYELLTGSTPIDGKKLRSLGYAEMLKTIREVEPPRPSTRLTQSPQEATNISANRHTEPRRLQKLVAGDLDWIVMKCLEKDRIRRYETANGLATDIQRHLQNEAVSASPPGQLYKLQKLIRRNKLPVAIAVALVLALLGGAGTSTWEAFRLSAEQKRTAAEKLEADRERDEATEQKAVAEVEAAKSNAVARFVSRMLAVANPRYESGEETTLRELLDSASENLDAGALRTQPLVEAEIQRIISDAYIGLALDDLAERHAKKELDCLQQIAVPPVGSVATALNTLGNAQGEQGDMTSAEASYRRALEMLRGEGSRFPELHIIVISNLSNLLRDHGRNDAVGAFQPEIEQTLQQLGAVDDEDKAAAFYQAGWYFYPNDSARAEQLLRQSLAIRKRALPPDDVEMTRTMNFLALSLQSQGRLDEAQEILSQAIAAVRSSERPRLGPLATLLSNLATVLEQKKEYAASEAAYRETISIRRKILAPNHPQLIHSQKELAHLLQSMGREAEARELLDEANRAASSTTAPSTAP